MTLFVKRCRDRMQCLSLRDMVKTWGVCSVGLLTATLRSSLDQLRSLNQSSILSQTTPCSAFHSSVLSRTPRTSSPSPSQRRRSPPARAYPEVYKAPLSSNGGENRIPTTICNSKSDSRGSGSTTISKHIYIRSISAGETGISVAI